MLAMVKAKSKSRSDTTDLNLYAWLIAGSQKRAVIRVMDAPMTPTGISKKVNISLNNASDTLRRLVKKGIAKCLTEERKTGRLYKLTGKGRLLKEKVLKNYPEEKEKKGP